MLTCSSSINIPSYLLCAQTIGCIMWRAGVYYFRNSLSELLGAFLEVCLVSLPDWNPALSINHACMHIPICHLGPYAWTVSCSCAVAYYMHPVIAHWKVSVSNQSPRSAGWRLELECCERKILLGWLELELVAGVVWEEITIVLEESRPAEHSGWMIWHPPRPQQAKSIRVALSAARWKLKNMEFF